MTTTPAAGSRRRARRSPRPEDRVRDSERTRERIVQAAVKEFGSKGYAGARTASIAARAGVNQQLISYYFGGKQGLLDELRQRWGRAVAAAAPADASFADSVTAYLDATLDHPDWARLLIWRALGDGPEDGNTTEPDRVERAPRAETARLRAAVERVRQRQQAGEIVADLDAEFVLLLAYAVAFAPIALPSTVRDIYGVDPLSPDYRRRVLEQLLRLVVAPDHVRNRT